MSDKRTPTSVRVFIISWPDYHERAIHIAQSLESVAESIYVVYSDPHPSYECVGPFTPVRRSHEKFWEDKFLACLEQAEQDYVLVIHADCESDDWSAVYRRYCQCIEQYPAIGVWAPHIEGTPYHWQRVKMAQIEKDHLYWALQTDAIVFGLAPRVVQRMRRVNYGQNLYGWGIDRLMCAAAFVRQLWVVIDTSCQVQHPSTRGYDAQQAREGMHTFYLQFDAAERIYHQMCDEVLLARQAIPRP